MTIYFDVYRYCCCYTRYNLRACDTISPKTDSEVKKKNKKKKRPRT